MPVSILDFFLDLPKTLAVYRITEDKCELIRNFSNDAHKLIPKFLEEMCSFSKPVQIC